MLQLLRHLDRLDNYVDEPTVRDAVAYAYKASRKLRRRAQARRARADAINTLVNAGVLNQHEDAFMLKLAAVHGLIDTGADIAARLREIGLAPYDAVTAGPSAASPLSIHEGQDRH